MKTARKILYNGKHFFKDQLQKGGAFYGCEDAIISAMEEYANQFKPSLVSEGEINKMAINYVKTLPAINYKSVYDFAIQNINAFTEGFKQGLQYTNQSDNSGKAIELLQLVSDNFYPVVDSRDESEHEEILNKIREYLNSINKGE